MKKSEDNFQIVNTFYIHNRKHIYIWVGLNFKSKKQLWQKIDKTIINLDRFFLEKAYYNVGPIDLFSVGTYFSLPNSEKLLIEKEKLYLEKEFKNWFLSFADLQNKTDGQNNFVRFLMNKTIPESEDFLFFIHYNRKLNQIIKIVDLEDTQQREESIKEYKIKTGNKIQKPTRIKNILKQFINNEEVEMKIALGLLKK